MATFLSRLDRRASNLGEMIQLCGVDPVALARERLGQTLISVARACICCRHSDACRRWLAAADRRIATAPAPFCPNAGHLRRADLLMQVPK